MAEIRPFPAGNFRELDEAKPSRLHWKIMFISGMGFFTDAYDLFIIGVVMSMLQPLWNVGKLEEGLVESTALLASAIGALLFGRVADMIGRKRIYGIEVLVLAAGHRLRLLSQRHHLRLPLGDFPCPRSQYRPRHRRSSGQAGRLPRRLHLPLPYALAWFARCGIRRRHRQRPRPHHHPGTPP
jgi:hypothetical protein